MSMTRRAQQAPVAGDAARAQLIEAHLPLVRTIALRHARAGEPLDELVQAGSIGLIKAVDRFDPSRGTELAAYAAPLIEGEVRHHLRQRSRRIARESPGRTDVSDNADHDERSEARLLLEQGWQGLSSRDRRLLELRYFEDLSQAEIARAVGLSQAQVSRLLRAALDRLRTQLTAGVAGDPGRDYSGSEMAVPEAQPDAPRTHSGRLLVRMPQSLHAELARAAEREGVSLNTLVTGALAAAVGWRHDADDPSPP